MHNVYNYMNRPANTLVVDFASKYIGGGALSEGFVQEDLVLVLDQTQCCLSLLLLQVEEVVSTVVPLVQFNMAACHLKYTYVHTHGFI